MIKIYIFCRDNIQYWSTDSNFEQFGGTYLGAAWAKVIEFHPEKSGSCHTKMPMSGDTGTTDTYEQVLIVSIIESII